LSKKSSRKARKARVGIYIRRKPRSRWGSFALPVASPGISAPRAPRINLDLGLRPVVSREKNQGRNVQREELRTTVRIEPGETQTIVVPAKAGIRAPERASYQRGGSPRRGKP